MVSSAVTNLKPYSKPYTITLEASKTGKADSSDWDQGTVPLDFAVALVTGVFDNAAGTGDNHWTGTYAGGVAGDNYLHLSAAAVTAIGNDTACWVTYMTGNTYDVAAGVPMGNAFNAAALVTVPTILNSIVATSDTADDYEISALDTGQTLEDEIRFVPPLGGVVITQIEVNTNGSDIDIGIYEGAETTGTVLNLKFKKENITAGVYNSSSEFPNLRIVIDDDAWRLGIVDTGANATPATTTVTVRGYPLV